MNDKLNDIKNSWQSIDSNDLKKVISKEDISKLLRKKSKTQLDKIKYTAIIESCIGIPLITLIGIYSSKPLYYGIIMLIVIIIGMVPTIRIFRLGKFENQPTIEYLKKFTITLDYILKSYLLISKYLYSIMAFVILPISIFINSDSFIKEDILIVMAMSFFLFIIYIPIYFLVKLYYKALYQKPNDRLKIILAELEEAENEENIPKQ